MAVKIITDSTSYIKKEIRENLDIRIVSLGVVFENQSYKETELDNGSFYKMMSEKGIPTSTQPSINEVYEEVKSIVEKGDSVLCVFISSDMSGTYSTAHMVKDMVLEQYKDAEIEIVDSRSNCMQLGFAAILAARAAKEGKNLQEVKAAAEENIRRSRFVFLPDNLEYLKKGGRIGGASALIGNLFKIIPILTVEDGKTSILTKVRTKKKAVSSMVDKMMQDIKNYDLGEVVVHHINCFGEAQELQTMIYDNTGIKAEICDIGPVIGVHVGPGAIGIAYYTKQNMR